MNILPLRIIICHIYIEMSFQIKCSRQSHLQSRRSKKGTSRKRSKFKENSQLKRKFEEGTKLGSSWKKDNDKIYFDDESINKCFSSKFESKYI